MDVNASPGDLDHFGDGDSWYSCTRCDRPKRSLENDGLCDRCAGIPPADTRAVVLYTLRDLHLRAAAKVAALCGSDDKDVIWHQERAAMFERRALEAARKEAS